MFLSINWKELKTMGKFALLMIGILFLVYLIAVMTPWLARKIDSNRANPERVKKGSYNFEKDELKSVYEKQTEKDENGDEQDNGKQ